MSAIRITCPLCDWHYDVPPLDPRISANTLAGVFGLGIMASIAINRRNEETEVRLQEHLQIHKLHEWVSKITALQAELNQLKAIS